MARRSVRAAMEERAVSISLGGVAVVVDVVVDEEEGDMIEIEL